jgi:hypothetical protein
MWPLALALVVGLTIGFAGGYGVGTREHASRAVAAPPAVAETPARAGREFTESAVPDAPKPAASEPAAPAPAPPRTSDVGSTTAENDGRLLVRSTPAGARVFVDGNEQGRTPAVVRDLPRGEHRVRVTQDGYTTEERRVVITPARPSQSMTIPLARPRSAAEARAAQTARATPATPGTAGRFTGALTVMSRPAGASVFLDGKMVGTTPVSIRPLAAGSHAIRLEHDGYRRWTSAIRVVANEHNRVTASLER